MFGRVKILVVVLISVLLLATCLSSVAKADEKKGKISPYHKKLLRRGMWELFDDLEKAFPELKGYYSSPKMRRAIKKMIGIAIKLFEEQNPKNITSYKIDLFFEHFTKFEIKMGFEKKYFGPLPTSFITTKNPEFFMNSLFVDLCDYFKYYKDKVWERNIILENQIKDNIRKIEGG